MKEIEPARDRFTWFSIPCSGGQNTKTAIVLDRFRLSFRPFGIFILHVVERYSPLFCAVASVFLALGDVNALPPNFRPCAWYVNSYCKMHCLRTLYAV